MRKPLGVIALVLGLGGLGLWSRAYDAHEIENEIADGATQAASPAIHGIDTTVSGRDITATGIADSAAEKAQILAALDAVTGRRVVRDAITVLPVASPYEMSFTKAEGGEALTAAGSVPSEAARADFAGLPGTPDVADLVLASGAPEDWPTLVAAAAAALEPLDFGVAALSDDRLTVTGQARTPREAEAVMAVLATLPEGRGLADLTLLDDGAPAIWNFEYDAASGAVVSGKLPLGMDLDAISAASGLSVSAGDLRQALTGDTGDALVLAGLERWLPVVEALTATVSPGQVDVVASVGPGTDQRLLTGALLTDLTAAAPGTGISVMIEESTTPGEDGAQRVNALTGANEVLRGGYWLPVLDFTPSLASCTEAANAVLGAATINFVSGSDQLDADARAVINRLASVILPCTGEGGLRARIGGHTDSTGDAEMNLGLSQRRAVAVRKALIGRGVPGAALRAQGYGASQPVADNDTEAGKAANRRTTIDWTD